MLRRAAISLLAFACGTGACAPDGPQVVLTVSTDSASTPIKMLARLRFIVRACDQKQLSILTNIDVNAPSRIDASLVPGETFYIWLQGWGQCGPTCVPEASASLGTDCECIDGVTPSMQQEVEEYCSSWMRAFEGRTEVTAVLGKVVPGRCPPAMLADCNNPPP